MEGSRNKEDSIRARSPGRSEDDTNAVDADDGALSDEHDGVHEDVSEEEGDEGEHDDANDSDYCLDSEDASVGKRLAKKAPPVVHAHMDDADMSGSTDSNARANTSDQAEPDATTIAVRERVLKMLDRALHRIIKSRDAKVG